jgi:hypothetical protein
VNEQVWRITKGRAARKPKDKNVFFVLLSAGQKVVHHFSE